MKKRRLYLSLLLLGFCWSLWGDSAISAIGFALEGVTPSFSTTTDNPSGLIGGSLKMKVLPYLGGTISFYYSAKNNNYSPDDGWNEIPADKPQWLFNQSSTIFSLSAAVYIPFTDQFQAYLFTGPALISYTKPDAASYYPELDEYLNSPGDTTTSFWGFISRVGMEVFLIDAVALGMDLFLQTNPLNNPGDASPNMQESDNPLSWRCSISCTIWSTMEKTK